MYGWMWRHLPGPVVVRVLLVLLLVAGVTVVCFEWVFPAIAAVVPLDNTMVGAP